MIEAFHFPNDDYEHISDVGIRPDRGPTITRPEEESRNVGVSETSAAFILISHRYNGFPDDAQQPEVGDQHYQLTPALIQTGKCRRRLTWEAFGAFR